MKQSFHGHELLRLIATAEPPLTEERLRALSRQYFGDSPSFHTCSLQGLSLDELLIFLIDRGKVRIADNTLTVVRERLCQDA